MIAWNAHVVNAGVGASGNGIIDGLCGGQIEKGRYCGTKVEDRICNLCKNGIEDEVHFLFTCPALNKYRDPYIKYIDEKHKNFSVLSDENKLIWLLSSEDKQLIMHLFRLLSVLFQERDKIISNI